MNPSVENFDQLAMAVLGWVGSGLLLGTMLAGLTWLVIRIFKQRSTPGLEVALWAIVLFKFVVPAGPEFHYSLPNLCGSLVRHVPMPYAIGGDIQVDSGEATAPLAGMTAFGSENKTPYNVWPLVLASSYAACVFLLLVLRIYRHLRFVYYCRALPPADERTMQLVRKICRKLRVRRVPLVRISKEFSAPFILGIIRPLLVLSRHQVVRPDELETVVVHEITHLRRGDPYLRCLQWIVGTFLFFWPIVHWVNRRIDMAREHACDERALRHGKLSASEYARCLLGTVPSVRLRRMAYRPICMAGSTTTLERRIDMILEQPARPNTRPIWKTCGLLFIVCWSAFVLSGAVAVREGISAVAEPTGESTKKHAQQIVNRIGLYPSADVDRDGQISFDERNAFLVAVFKESPGTAIDSFPYAGPFRGRRLQLNEVYDVVRGLSYRKEALKQAEMEIKLAVQEGAADYRISELKHEAKQIELECIETVLKAQDSLLDKLTAEPDLRHVEKVHAKLELIMVKKKQEKLEQEFIMQERQREYVEQEADLQKKQREYVEQEADLQKKQREYVEQEADLQKKQQEHIKQELNKLKQEADELYARGEYAKAKESKLKYTLLQIEAKMKQLMAGEEEEKEKIDELRRKAKKIKFMLQKMQDQGE